MKRLFGAGPGRKKTEESVLNVSFLQETDQVILKRSVRKTISAEISRDARVVVRAPKGMSDRQIESFLQRRALWIDEHLSAMKKRIREGSGNIADPDAKWTEQELKELKKQAAQDLKERAAKYAPLVGVTYQSVSIRAQKTRWGSCSSKGNISLNCLLILLPESVRDYVVVHELCHRKEMNHSARFWTEVAKVCPDYKKAKKILREQGAALIAKL